MSMLGRTLTIILALLVLGSGHAFADERIVVVTSVVYPGQEIDPALTREVVLRKPLRTRAKIARSAVELVGRVARRTILPNRAIPVATLREAYLVEAGDSVRTIYTNGGLSITMTGVALTPGTKGSAIRVRNPSSGRIVTGIVTAAGTVEVEPL